MIDKFLDWREPTPIPVTIFILAVLSVPATICLIILWHLWSLIMLGALLLAWGLWVLIIINHPLAKIYRRGTGIKTWHLYQDLPAEIKSSLPTLKPAGILEMTGTERDEIYIAFNTLLSEYKKKQKLERSPKNMQILDSAQTLITDMRTYNEELAKIS